MTSIPADKGDSKLGAEIHRLSTALTNAVSELSENLWQGRLVHKGKNQFSIKVQTVIAAVITFVGVVLAFTGSPYKGLLAIGIGMGWLSTLKEHWGNENQLEEACKFLAGKRDLNSLPKLDLTVKHRRFENLTLDKFTHDITAITVSGKLRAVAFKYSDPQINNIQTVSIFDLEDSLEPILSGRGEGVVDQNNNKLQPYWIDVTNQLKARDGKMLEKIFVKPNAGDRKAQA